MSQIKYATRETFIWVSNNIYIQYVYVHCISIAYCRLSTKQILLILLAAYILLIKCLFIRLYCISSWFGNKFCLNTIVNKMFIDIHLIILQGFVYIDLNFSPTVSKQYIKYLFDFRCTSVRITILNEFNSIQLNNIPKVS